MLKLQVPRWSERPRILMLMLAMILPAAALIVFSAFYLRNMQREKAIEAAYQVEYQHVLAIAEKEINWRMYETADQARSEFPDRENPSGVSFSAQSPRQRHLLRRGHDARFGLLHLVEYGRQDVFRQAQEVRG